MAEREAAEVRQKVAAEREQAVAQLKQAHDEAQARTAELLAEATKHHDQSAERLEADIAEAARIRAGGPGRGRAGQGGGVRESDARVATAKQATAISERTQQEFTWRKQQLRRETELLHQRKQAVLSQLASLSALAEQTANAFPDLDDPADLEGDEPGDATVLRSGPSRAARARTTSRRTTHRPRRCRALRRVRRSRRPGEQRSPRRPGGGRRSRRAGGRRRRDGADFVQRRAGRHPAPVPARSARPDRTNIGSGAPGEMTARRRRRR